MCIRLLHTITKKIFAYLTKYVTIILYSSQCVVNHYCPGLFKTETVSLCLSLIYYISLCFTIMHVYQFSRPHCQTSLPPPYTRYILFM